jgi:hypothetical protein
MSTADSATPKECQWCGQIHKTVCPKVKSIEYEVGMIKRVEFFAPNDYAPKLGAGGSIFEQVFGRHR